MTKISIILFSLFFGMSLRVQAAQFSATLDPHSTPGDFYGSLSLSFSSTNAQDYGYNSFLGRDAFNLSAYLSPTYTAPGQAATVSLSFVVGPNGGPQNDYLICNFPAFTDPRTGGIGYGNIYGASFQQQTVSPLTFGLVLGQSSHEDITFSTGDVPYGDNFNPSIGTLDFSYALPVDFDGASANAVGSWSLTYTVTPAPEPSAGWLLGLGGLSLWRFQAVRGRRSV